MMSLLTRIIELLPAASGTLVPQRHIGANVHLARCPSGSLQIILSDAEPPSRALTLRRAILEEGVTFVSEHGEDLTGCVLLEFDPGVDPGAVSKIAEHLCGDGEGERSGDDLIDSVETFQSLLENSSSRWGWNSVIGLWGELSCLERMLLLCADDKQRMACIKSWKSTGVHCIDFVFDHGLGAVFDAKTTSRTKRDHIVTSVDQVSAGIYGETHLLSLMIRPVAEGEGWTIMDLLNRMADSLTGDAAILFERKVATLEIDAEVCDAHRFKERDGRPPRLFPAADVPGVSRFLPLPEGVPELSWPVQLPEGGVSGPELDDILQKWIVRETEAIL